MVEGKELGLLPAGLKDVLAPDAAFEAAVIERVLAELAGHGYERVKPPLVEFEENLIEGSGQAMAMDIFRVMDPVSRRMMGVRADMTLQVARIARSRLATAPRPLRLSYAGEVLRVKGGGLRPEREFAQVGFELIGNATPEGDAEVVRLVAEGLAAVGVADLTIDLNAPTLVPLVCAALGLEGGAAQVARRALDRKDAAAVEALGGEAGALLAALLAVGGPAHTALPALAKLDLPDGARQSAAELGAVAELVATAIPDLGLTVDAVEHRGFEYHSGVSFSIFARAEAAELGRGGRYNVGDPASGESATGASLYMHTVLRALSPPPDGRRIFLPLGTDLAVGAGLRAEGWITIAGLQAAGDTGAEAALMRCGWVWDGAAARALESTES
jgi:ATP phosphoribosyltransferase regulatory subunit